jgi:hypothetical protein
LWNFLTHDSPSDNTNHNQEGTISKDQFVTRIQESAKTVDFHRLWPLTLSMLMVGSTVGVTTPAMVRVNKGLPRTTAIIMYHMYSVFVF